ncbi:hypothetical protein ACQKWADRAFT_96537 [Trichoderma austrokoningii]
MLCPKWKSCRDAMPTPATHELASQFQTAVRSCALSIYIGGILSSCKEESSFVLSTNQSTRMAKWHRGPRGNVYYLGMALEDLYDLTVERSRDVSRG